MAFDVNNFVIDHVIRGLMQSTTDESIMWSINQITDPSLKVTTETKDAVDAMGTPIMTFNRAKNSEFTASNSLFDLGLAAAQFGTDKKVAGVGNTITVPMFEEITTTASATVTLKKTPKTALTAMYKLNGDDTLGTKYTKSTSATATTFVHSEGTNSVTIPTGLTTGTKLFVTYEYETTEAVAVSSSAKDFPRAGKFIMEVLGSDVCDPSKLIHAYIVFGNAKLLGDVDLSFTTEGNHPFTIKANVSYCDNEKKLFSILIPNE